MKSDWIDSFSPSFRLTTLKGLNTFRTLRIFRKPNYTLTKSKDNTEKSTTTKSIMFHWF